MSTNASILALIIYAEYTLILMFSFVLVDDHIHI